jgi:hypothetical protein
MATRSSATTKNNLQRGDYVSIKDPTPRGNDRSMPTVRGFSCGIICKIHNDGRYVTVVLPNGVKQKIPRGRCKLLKDEKEYFKHILKGSKYQ